MQIKFDVGLPCEHQPCIPGKGAAGQVEGGERLEDGAWGRVVKTIVGLTVPCVAMNISRPSH